MKLEFVDTSPKKRLNFLQLPVRLYKENNYWIRPLDSDIEDIFDSKKNKLFRHGECVRWVLYNDVGVCIGRVAAFFDQRLLKPGIPKVGGMGFFECENNTEAANHLFLAVENWLKEKGLEGVDGSINFGERDKNWGVLVEGFDREPNYGMPYNHPYYSELFEQYGYKNYFYQLTYERPVLDPLIDKLKDKYQRIKQDSNYRFFHWDNNRSDELVRAFTDIYNQAWSRHAGVPSMSHAHVKSLFAKLKPVMDKRLIWFGYYGDRPIAFFLMLPELNQFFKHVNGKLDVWGKIKFAWYRYVVGTENVFGVVFGVIPDFQGKGIEGALIVECQTIFHKTRYKSIEMNWIGDFNPKMLHLMENLGAKIVKKHATYRLYFDRNYSFQRAKKI